jgi:hypothetical protein
VKYDLGKGMRHIEMVETFPGPVEIDPVDTGHIRDIARKKIDAIPGCSVPADDIQRKHKGFCAVHRVTGDDDQRMGIKFLFCLQPILAGISPVLLCLPGLICHFPDRLLSVGDEDWQLGTDEHGLQVEGSGLLVEQPSNSHRTTDLRNACKEII